MYTNIILNTLPLWKSYGLPFLIVHLEMQFFLRILRMDVITKIVLTRGNTIFRFTSSTFIFDRGKDVISIKSTGAVTQNFNNCKYIYFTQNKFRIIYNKMSNSKMPSMFTYADAAKRRPFSVRKANDKKLGNNQLNEISSQYENKKQSNRHASRLLQHAQLLQTSYENSLEKMMSINPVENMIDLISRAERIILSNCILLTGLPMITDEFPLKTFKTWVQLMVPHLESQLRITVKGDELMEYLHEFPDGTIQHDGDSCAFPIPIHQTHFKLGGITSPIPDALGVTAGGLKNIFCMFQAIPTQIDPISSIRKSVELCTLRGLPGNPFEVQAIVAMVYHKIETYFAPLSNMDPKDFDIIVHRRAHKRQHSARPQSYEFVITVYCRPKGKSPGAIRELIDIPSGPADICLDWKGEAWANYFLMSQQTPSMVLLHKTPTICISGFNRDADSRTIITAFMEDNSTLPLVTLLYCWIGPRGEAASSRALHLVFSDTPPAIAIGVNLVSIGAQRQDGDQYDNPSMEFTRNLIAGIIVHHQFMAGSSKGQWTMQMRTAWATRVAKIVKEMPTLKKGNKLGLTHAGLSTWESPVFIGTPSPLSQPREDTRPTDNSEYRERPAPSRRSPNLNVNDLPSDDDEDDDDMSFHSSSMSEEPRRRVRPAESNLVDKEYIQEILEAQEVRFQNRIEQLLSRMLPTNTTESSTVMEGGSQSGGSHSNSLYNT